MNITQRDPLVRPHYAQREGKGGSAEGRRGLPDFFCLFCFVLFLSLGLSLPPFWESIVFTPHPLTPSLWLSVPFSTFLSLYLSEFSPHSLWSLSISVLHSLSQSLSVMSLDFWPRPLLSPPTQGEGLRLFLFLDSHSCRRTAHSAWLGRAAGQVFLRGRWAEVTWVTSGLAEARKASCPPSASLC
uniref:Uncharacterized protein n=1 Tax=Myotis myotis TaxID=51298 RepID=A0A7J7R990_MYOMY|nr:hypothetical protein mMyoMyo1_010872 [Myotis myotis]